MSVKQKTRISALLPSLLTRELQKESRDRNVTQSSIIEYALHMWLRKKLRTDAKELSKLRFNDLPSEEEWAAIQSEISI